MANECGCVIGESGDFLCRYHAGYVDGHTRAADAWKDERDAALATVAVLRGLVEMFPRNTGWCGQKGSCGKCTDCIVMVLRAFAATDHAVPPRAGAIMAVVEAAERWADGPINRGVSRGGWLDEDQALLDALRRYREGTEG